MSSLLPRRLNTAEPLSWGGIAWLMHVGWDRAGAVREIFLEGIAEEAGETVFALNAELRASIHAQCIVLSHLLQRGEDVGVLAERLAPNPGVASRPLLAVVTAKAAALEREIGSAVREAYLCAEGRHPAQLAAGAAQARASGAGCDAASEANPTAEEP